MVRNIVRHIAVVASLVALAMVVLPQPASAATKKVWYKVKVRTCSAKTHKCTWRYVWHYKYVYVAAGTAKGVTSYKPSYNIMSVNTSRKGIAPKGATAVCADGHYVYSSAVTAGCAAHHGVAWKF